MSLRRLFRRTHAPGQASPPIASSSRSLAPGKASGRRELVKPYGPLQTSPNAEESESFGLWGEVYHSFLTSDTSPDLRAIAEQLREESRVHPVVDPQQGNTENGLSVGLQACREVLHMAQSSNPRFADEKSSPYVQKLRTAYTEIIKWTQKFVALGDIVSQVDPIHVGLPWVGIRAILLVGVAVAGHYPSKLETDHPRF